MKIGSEEAYERLLTNPGTVFLLGAVDTGKTSFGLGLLKAAAAAEIPAALVDADIGQSLIGPPTTVGLRIFTTPEAVAEDSLGPADALEFVGSLSPRGHLLPLVTSTAKLVTRARNEGCRLIVVDTTGYVSGIYAQTLKFHKMDVSAPDFVVGFERGGELEPLIGIAQRFTPAEVLELEVPEHIGTRSVEERMAHRMERFKAYFGPSASRWRVKPTVFMPTLPPEFDLGRLDGLIVGMEDGQGHCAGIGVLEYDAAEGILRMVSPVTQGVRGLRLGHLKIDPDGSPKGSVSLSELFGTE